jgi:hypothetical protein
MSDDTREKDRKRLFWIASDGPAKREPPPLGLFENATVGVIDVCSVLARCLVRLEAETRPHDDRQLAAVNAAYDAMCDETRLPDDFDAAQTIAMAAINAFVAAASPSTADPTGGNDG